MATLGSTKFGISTKFTDPNQNTISKTYNGLNLSGDSSDAMVIDGFFKDASDFAQAGGGSVALFDLLSGSYSVLSIERNMNNEVVTS